MINPVSVPISKSYNPLIKNQHMNFATPNAVQKDTFVPSTKVANVSFTSVDDSVVGNTIRELKDVPCPYCGIKVINGKELKHLNKDNLSGSSKEAVELLTPFENRMHSVEKEVFGIIKEQSKNAPEKNLREILDPIRPQHLENVINKEYEVFEDIINYSADNVKNKKTFDSICDLIGDTKLIIQAQDENYIFSRNKFLDKLDDVTQNIHDEKIVKDIKEIANGLPNADNDVSAFIVKFTQKDPNSKIQKMPHQIANALLEPSIGSLEHIRPRHPENESEEGGLNIYSNYIYASKELNSKRGNMPLDQWVQKNPEVKDYMQQYMDSVIEKINSGKAMQKCKVYPIAVAKTLAEESKGLLQVDTSKLKLSPEEIKEGLEKLKVEEENIAKEAKEKAENDELNGNMSVRKRNKKQPKPLNLVA